MPYKYYLGGRWYVFIGKTGQLIEVILHNFIKNRITLIYYTNLILIKNQSNTIEGFPGVILANVYFQFFPSLSGALLTSTN